MKKNLTENERKQREDNAETVAIALAQVLGAKVVSHKEFDALNRRNQQLLKEIEDHNKLQMAFWSAACKLQAFIQYHSKWKPTTRKFEKRMKKLQKENLYLDFQNYPTEVCENLKESYNCYINGLDMACYIMILRTLEITINFLYAKENKPKLNNNGKQVFVPTTVKLNWAKNEKYIGGMDFTVAKGFIEARNDSIHDVVTPTEKQIISAFETAIILVKKLTPLKK